MYDVVEIEWMNAQSSLDLIPVERVKKFFKPHSTKTIGYLIHETEQYVILAFMDFGEGEYKHWQAIPVGMIKTRKIIK